MASRLRLRLVAATLHTWRPSDGALGQTSSNGRAGGCLARWRWDGLWYPAQLRSRDVDGTYTAQIEGGFLQMGTPLQDLRAQPAAWGVHLALVLAGLVAGWLGWRATLGVAQSAGWCGWVATVGVLVLAWCCSLRESKAANGPVQEVEDTVWMAARRGDLPALERMVAECPGLLDQPEPLSQGLLGRTALYLAAHCGHYDAVVWLVQRGARDHDGSALITVSSKEAADETDDLLFDPDEGVFSDFRDYSVDEAAALAGDANLAAAAAEKSVQIKELLRAHRQGPQNVFKAAERMVCAVCMTATVDAVCSPCGHAACCRGCLERIRDARERGCPICRMRIREILPMHTDVIPTSSA